MLVAERSPLNLITFLSLFSTAGIDAQADEDAPSKSFLNNFPDRLFISDIDALIIMSHYLQNNPVIIPAEAGKLIEEHFGRVATQHEQISIARMIAPSGWEEPFQTPEFDEWTLVNRGKKQVEVDGETLVLEAGKSILIKAGSRVRYSNPFQEECEYWSICLPAFSIDTVNREG